MFNSSNGSSDRRILTYLAVHPCRDIAPATLILSLINLSSTICSYKSKFFATNRRHASQIIRQIGILQSVFEEIRDGRLNLLNSEILCFSELHFTFQRLVFLLEDCSRDGARLWILMNSELVLTQFRVLSRSISTALDILMLESFDVSSESKDLIGLVMRQTRKSTFEIESKDKQVLIDVRVMLNRLENQVVPDRSDLIRVTDYLGIRRWSDCNKEVRFLDAEIIAITVLNEGKKETLTLSSLLGFMSYCRCVVFDVVNGEAMGQSDGGNGGGGSAFKGLNPDDFFCPISLELMTDPVTISTGHTYDRSSILKWFKSGNLSCPKTGEKLRNSELVPNLVLGRLIQQHCSGNGISIPRSNPGHKNRNLKTIVAGTLAAEGALKLLGSFLVHKLEVGTVKDKNKAAYEIRLLTKTSIFNRSCLVEAGIIGNLLMLLASPDLQIQENAMAGLLNLSKHQKGKASIVENGGLKVIIDVLQNGLKSEARQHAAAILFYIGSVEEYRELIGEIPEAIPALVELIKDGTDRSKKNALIAIFGLLMHHGNRSKVHAAGSVPLLINLLRSSDKEDLITDSLAVLATLAEKPEGTFEILGHEGLHQIVEILSSLTLRTGQEYSVSLLLALCINGGADVVAVLGQEPSLIESLYSLLSDGTPRTRKKASALIRILHEFCERRSSSQSRMVPPVVPQQQFVHIW